MTDLETRLRDSLTRSARNAPTTVGLAARVRVRRRTRRATTAWAAGVLVAAVVVLIAVVPGLLGSTGGELGPSDSPSGGRTLEDGWRTVTISEGGRNRFDVDLPEDFPESGIFTYPADRRDRERPQGRVRGGIDSVFGEVLLGDTVVTVDLPKERVTVRRVLASVRPAGSPGVEVTGWETETVSDEYGEVTVRVPEDPRVVVSLERGFPDCDPGRTPAEPDGDGGWTASLCRDRIVTVSAPTQALADVVAATVKGY